MENKETQNLQEAQTEQIEKKEEKNLKTVTTEIRNKVNIVGYIDSDITLSHKVHDEGIYTFMLKVPRVRNDVFDTLIVELPERGNNLSRFSKGDRVRIEGQFRSANRRREGETKNYLHLAIFVDSINPESSTYKVNEVRLRGNICKKPNLRVTSKGKDICDVLIAVNRTYGRADYIPCITWGRDAKYIGEFEVGKGFFIVGRLQSRIYHKKLENGEVVDRTTYEVSVSEIKEMREDESVTETRVIPA